MKGNRGFGLRRFAGRTDGRRRYVGLTGITALACLIVGVGVAFAVSGAVSTTDNPLYVGPGTYTNQAVQNGKGVNGNIYLDKRDVWFSGLPVKAALGAGTYFFAVLSPGGQPNPNDCAALKSNGDDANLSDTTPSCITDNTGAGDTWQNRVFSVNSNGTITYPAAGYPGGHNFDATNNKIQLVPYDDTPNPGGVYILAVCAVPSNPIQPPSGPGVNPRDCKYDAFKVKESNPPSTPPAAGATVTKDAAGAETTSYTWDISKTEDVSSEVDNTDGSLTVAYTVHLTHDAGTSSYTVSGTISVFNPNVDGDNNVVSMDINGLTDSLSDGTKCTVTGAPNPTVTLTEFQTDFAYSCALSGAPAAQLSNTVKVTWDAQDLNLSGDSNNLSHLDAGSDTMTFPSIAFSANQLVHNCATVTDQTPSDGTSNDNPFPKDVCIGDAANAATGNPGDGGPGKDPGDGFTWTYHVTYADAVGTCTNHSNMATFTVDDKTTITGSDEADVRHCVGEDLTVSKTATPAFTRTYNWSISKLVDGVSASTKSSSTGSASFNYSVVAGETGFTDSGWQVTGTITVTNPNDWQTVQLTGITDLIDNGGSCSFDTAADTAKATSMLAKSGDVLGGDSVTLNYTCTYSKAPTQSSFTNTATASWDQTTAVTPDGSKAGTKAGDFASASVTRSHQTITPTDAFNGGLGENLCTLDTSAAPTYCTLTASDTTPYTTHTYTYARPLSSDPGTCTTYPNTASDGIGDTSSASAKVCVGADLTVDKTANPSFRRTYNWSITKNVDKTKVTQSSLTPGATFNYSVTVSQTGLTDSGWTVTGTITVANPNDWESVVLTGVTDSISNGGTCTINAADAGKKTATLTAKGTAGSSVTLGYTCTYSSKPASYTAKNTATATWSATAASTPHGSASKMVDANLTTPTTTNKTITPTDAFNGGSGVNLCTLDTTAAPTYCTLTASDTTPYTTHTYTYSRTVPIPTSGCVSYTNTAKIVETGQSAQKTVQVCRVPLTTGALTMGFWQNKNGLGIVTGGAATSGVCNSGTWLRQYAPFQDLSATATCAQVGTYVTNIIKAANAGGTSMNPMLKAQMLATALDVYFSDSGLGGNKIGAFNGLGNNQKPIGGIAIDLTAICKMTDSSSGTGTCSGVNSNASSAFGGATSLTVSQLLSYAASQSNAGGSLWYGQVKATQELAKNTFDAINNQAAFGP